MILKKIVMDNFMMHSHEEVDFSKLTKITGMNGQGKSSIATAYMWCLFDCDYQLKSNPAVRKVVDGKTVDDVDTSVTLILDVDGKEISMKKVQKRSYSKDGSSFKDDNKYFVNDVPKTLKDFNAYLDMDMSTMKMCSNINAFLNQKPTEMREFLFGLAENVSDVEIAKKNNLGIAIDLEKYTAEELSAMNKKVVADINKALPVFDGQIMEKTTDIQRKSDIDTAELELQKNVISEQMKEIEEKLDCIRDASVQHDSLTDELMKLKFQVSDLQNKANAELGKKRDSVKAEISELESSKSANEQSRQTTINKINDLEIEIRMNNSDREKCFEDWKIANAREFDENSLICSYCGQTLPEETQKEMRSTFTQKKDAELKRITDRGELLKGKIDTAKTELDGCRTHLANLEKVGNAYSKNLMALKKQLDAIPATVDISGLREYKQLASEISGKEEKLKMLAESKESRIRLSTEQLGLRDKLFECEREIAKSNTEDDEKRLAELKQLRMTAEQNKADAERVLDELNELEKAKNESLSDAINSHFNIVKWQLFEYAKNGNYKNCCIPMVDGKSILTTASNKGNQILGKVDICNSIQKATGMTVPVFMDDCESLDSANQKKVENMIDGQLVMLIVNDNKLEIERC